MLYANNMPIIHHSSSEKKICRTESKGTVKKSEKCYRKKLIKSEKINKIGKMLQKKDEEKINAAGK